MPTARQRGIKLSQKHSPGHEAAAIHQRHGRAAAHTYLARQNLAAPMPRSKALATREGGVGVQPHLTASQRQTANKLVSDYESGPRIGNLGHALDRLGKAYVDNPVSRNPIVGRKGILGAVEDLVKTTDPIALGQTLAKTARHPLASRSSTSLNAGIVIGGPGGFRGAGETAAELTRPRTRAEAEARLSKLEGQQERFQKAVQGRYKSVLPEEQARLNAAKGIARKAAKSTKPIKGGKKAARVEQPQGTVADEFLQRTVDEAVAKYPNHPAVKAYLANVEEANRLRESLNAQHLPGETPKPADYGTVRLNPEQVAVQEKFLSGVKGAGRRPPPREPGPPAPPGGGEPPREGEVKLPEGSLKAARKAYKGSVPLRTAERAQRFEKAHAAGERAGHGEAGYYAELGQMKGKLPHVSFDALREGHVSQDVFDQYMTRIATHPALQHGEKLSGRRALMDARDFGKPPPPHAQLIWQKAFGHARAKALTPRDQHWFFDLATLPRSVMATADLSGILRQGLVAAHQEPVLAAKAARAQVSFFRSKGAFERSQHEITQRPNYERMQTGKLGLTDVGGDLAQREEAFMSQITQHVPIMAGSSRAYIGGLNKLRADMFDKQIERLQAKGRDINDPKLLQSVARQINSATGRGDYGVRGNQFAGASNALFFSPRLIKSRLDYLNPHWYYKLDPAARSQAIKGVSRLAGTMAALLYGAHLAGAKLQGDPRSSDFAKIRFGNTRLDPLGGFQQYIRAGSQIASGKMISTTTGKTTVLGSGFGKPTRLDIGLHFGESKLNPTASFIVDALNQHGYSGQSFNLSKEAYSRMIPLLWQDVYSVYKDTGSAGLAALLYGVGGVGVGVQNYGPKKPKVKHYGGGRSGGSDPLIGGSSSNPFLPSGGGSSNPYLP